MKITVSLVILLLFALPVFADVSISDANCTAEAYCTTYLDGNCIQLNAGENYTLTSDVTSCLLFFSGNQDPTVFTRINLNGYTVHPSAQDAIMSSPEFVNVEIYNGTLGQNSFSPSYADDVGCIDMAVAGGQGSWANVYIHDLTFNCDGSAIRASRTENGGYYGNKGLVFERVNFNLTGSINEIPDNAITTTIIKDSSVNCPSGCGLIGGYQTYTNLYLENVAINSGTGYFWTVGNIPDETSFVSVKNVTKLDLDTAMETAGSAQYLVYQPATITAKDQNNALINANAELVNLNGETANFLPTYNPTKHVDIAVTNGVGTTFVLTNSSFNGARNLNLQTYSVTVRSRNQVQNKIVTFHSPAEETFTFDFTSEDAGQNVVVDNRTLGEKATNAVSKTVIPMMAFITSILLPFLAML